MSISLILADDHPLILDGLENLFRLEIDFNILARTSNGVETLNAVRKLQPAILVLDIRMPGKNGIEIAREMKSESLPTKIVLLTAELDEKEFFEAVHLGVQGIVLKEMAPQLLVQCIRKVYEGEQWLERRATSQALESMLRKEAGERELADILTARELDIVKMVTEGLRNKEIAGQLFISEGTVKVHLHNIYDKLKVDGRMALLRFAREKGVV